MTTPEKPSRPGQRKNGRQPLFRDKKIKSTISKSLTDCKSVTLFLSGNKFQNANGPADSAGCHIDFNCNDVIVENNLSRNNAGGFIEILGNNYNCSYRNNISINDGHRVKGENGAFQEGKTFWLSGYIGRGKERNGPFNSYKCCD